MLPDNFAVNLLKFCCANIGVMKFAVPTDSNNNVTEAVLKITTALIFVTKVELCNYLVYNIIVAFA